MQPLGDQLLAGAALADHQHRPVERRGAAGALERVEKGQAIGRRTECFRSMPEHWCIFPSLGKRNVQLTVLNAQNCGFPPLSRLGTGPAIIGGTPTTAANANVQEQDMFNIVSNGRGALSSPSSARSLSAAAD